MTTRWQYASWGARRLSWASLWQLREWRWCWRRWQRSLEPRRRGRSRASEQGCLHPRSELVSDSYLTLIQTFLPVCRHKLNVSVNGLGGFVHSQAAMCCNISDKCLYKYFFFFFFFKCNLHYSVIIMMHWSIAIQRFWSFILLLIHIIALCDGLFSVELFQQGLYCSSIIQFAQEMKESLFTGTKCCS